jgi:hypothetical protein
MHDLLGLRHAEILASLPSICTKWNSVFAWLVLQWLCVIHVLSCWLSSVLQLSRQTSCCLT